MWRGWDACRSIEFALLLCDAKSQSDDVFHETIIVVFLKFLSKMMSILGLDCFLLLIVAMLYI